MNNRYLILRTDAKVTDGAKIVCICDKLSLQKR